ncbi:cell division ATP-binding protein FtsE [Sneathiella glossodoripedis]|uniref:cell division ATP-binding protein FtsE n=1 Tax=Sneathiella glossodoripedis TaxID=418853 RepID=UPI0004708B04|nr:cell division ATP-binding protein FtsE [Sneathiella glossodoripedis]
MVIFENVGMRYGMGPEVLRDINMHLASGSFHFLTGPTGAGKSSLLKLLALSHRPSRGLLTLFGQEVSRLERSDLPSFRRKIGVVFQDFRLLDHLSALENVALPLRIAEADEELIEKNVTELLNWVGLGHQMQARPPTLSGGEKQRVAIARAVINRPQLLIADEPTGSMDPEMGLRLMHLFQELNKLGTTVVIATHDIGLIQKFQYPVMYLRSNTLHFATAQEYLSQYKRSGV